MTFTTAVPILFTSFVYSTNVYWSVIHGIKRKPHLSVVWNWYHFVAIAILHQPRPTHSADINTWLQLSDISSIPPMHVGFLLIHICQRCHKEYPTHMCRWKLLLLKESNSNHVCDLGFMDVLSTIFTAWDQSLCFHYPTYTHIYIHIHIHIHAYIARLQCVNSSPPSAIYLCQWTGLALVQVMACRLFGAKPLPEPMLPYCQLDPWEQSSVKFES